MKRGNEIRNKQNFMICLKKGENKGLEGAIQMQS